LDFLRQATVCKYVVPEGYPDAPVKNSEIDISQIQQPEHLYLAAVDARNGKLFATGSRTAAVVGIGATLAAAEQQAENEVCRIKGQLFHREDIGTAKLIEKRIRHMQQLREVTA
jgi:phosphoribosylamine--glycine ligase